MLMTDTTETPSPMADGTSQTGFASETQAKSASTVQAIRPAIDDAKAAGREALGAAKDIAGDAWKTAQSYAKNASGVAGEKLGALKTKAADFQVTASRRIADEPLKAVAIGAAAGALLAALVLRRKGGPRS